LHAFVQDDFGDLGPLALIDILINNIKSTIYSSAKST